MARNIKRIALGVLAAAAMTAAVPAGNASATTMIPCDNNEYVKITDHATNATSYNHCFANAGTVTLRDPIGYDVWLTRIWSGNNRVQWFGDGRWQPETPIGKWTSFTWPNHPGGVKIEKIRIL